MSKFHPLLSGREARRMRQFGPGARRKGAGWTRRFRKGREQRLPRQEEQA
jgi:hypothetical protein